MRIVGSHLGWPMALAMVGCIAANAAENGIHEQAEKPLAFQLADAEARFRQTWGGLTAEELSPPAVSFISSSSKRRVIPNVAKTQAVFRRPRKYCNI